MVVRKGCPRRGVDGVVRGGLPWLWSLRKRACVGRVMGRTTAGLKKQTRKKGDRVLLLSLLLLQTGDSGAVLIDAALVCELVVLCWRLTSLARSCLKHELPPPAPAKHAPPSATKVQGPCPRPTAGGPIRSAGLTTVVCFHQHHLVLVGKHLGASANPAF